MKLNQLISQIVTDCVDATESVGVKLNPLIEMEVNLQPDGNVAKLTTEVGCRTSLSFMVPRNRPLTTPLPSPEGNHRHLDQ